MGVEVDEAFHKGNRESNLKRELTIEEWLSSVREDTLFELKRIDAMLPLGELTKRIEGLAEEIKQKIVENKITQWDTDISIKTQIQKKASITVDDFYRFRLITDVANQLFFKKYKGYQQASFSMSLKHEPAQVWFPTISTIEKEEHNQWLNYLNEDWSVITEMNIRGDGKALPMT